MKRTWVKVLYTTLIIFSVTASAAKENQTKNWILANPGDFITLGDVTSPEFQVFLSYTGVRFNHCGISVRLSPWWRDAGPLAKTLLIEDRENGRNIAKVEGNHLVAPVDNPKQMTYGEIFTLKTRSGQSIADAIAQLSTAYKTEAIVEILPCKQAGSP